MADHRLRVVGADQHQVEAADAVGDRLELDAAGLGHGAGVERGDLVVVLVRGAHEARGVPGLGDVDGPAVHVVALQPAAVLGEVRAGRADQDRAQAEHAHAEGDVRRDAAAADVEGVDQEGQRHGVQLLGDQLVGEPAGEGHQVVGRDRTGDGDTHGVSSGWQRGHGTAGGATHLRYPAGPGHQQDAGCVPGRPLSPAAPEGVLPRGSSGGCRTPGLGSQSGAPPGPDRTVAALPRQVDRS